MHTTTDSSRRPFASKLSGFMRGQASKSKKQQPPQPALSSDNGSVFGFKRQKRTPGPTQDSALDFKPLEVDLNSLESMRLSEGWLESPKRRPEREPERQQQPAPVSENTTTPIAAMFASKSVLNFQDSGQPSRSGSHTQTQTDTGRQPLSLVEPNGIIYGRRSVDLASNSDAQSTRGSILDRGRPVEPSLRNVSDPPSKPPSWRQELPPLQSSISSHGRDAASRDSVLRPSRSSAGGVGSITAKPLASSQLQVPGKLESNNRHSMYAVGTVSLGPAKLVQTRSVSAAPVERIQAWQKSVTSAPNPLASSASAPVVPSQSGAPVRRTSTRGAGGLGNRLAWIRELEEKKSASVNSDLGVLKKQSGSVSNKLAMFESRQKPAAAPVARLPPLTRTNSTTSTTRFSSVGLGSDSSASGNAAATPRTSIDTARSSHRASSVMDYYDDTFRERMESMVSGYNEKDKPDAQKKQRITTQFVPIRSGMGEDKSPSASHSELMAELKKGGEDSPTPELGPAISNTESAQAIEELPASAIEINLSSAESPKKEEESQPSQPEAEVAAIQSEEAKEEATKEVQSEAEEAKEEPQLVQQEEAKKEAETFETQAEEEPKSDALESVFTPATDVREPEKRATLHEANTLETPITESVNVEDKPQSAELDMGISAQLTERLEEQPLASKAEAETHGATDEVEELPKSAEAEKQTPIAPRVQLEEPRSVTADV